MKKKYLTTPEDILALKDTDTKIYTEGTNEYYQFVQGVLCYFDEDESVVMFSEIGIGKGYLNRYILEEEPVKEVTEEDVGKLCWMWDTDEEYKTTEVLKRITQTFSYEGSSGAFWHHCRRLTPAEVAEITGYKVEE